MEGNKIKAMMFFIMLICGALLLSGYLFYSCTMCKDHIVIREKTVLLKYAESPDPYYNRVLATLEKGAKGCFINVRYSKDYKYLKIKTESGAVGYVDSYYVESGNKYK